MDPNTQRIALGAAGAGGQTEYWHDEITYNGSTNNINIGTVYDGGNIGTYIDSDNNIYSVGWIDGSTDFAFIFKRDADGVFQWARTLSDSTVQLRYLSIESDGTYLYVFGEIQGLRTYLSALVVVYDLDGNIQSQQDYYQGSYNTQFINGKRDSSGNFYAHSALQGNHVAVKLNSSLNVQWTTGVKYSPYGVGSGQFQWGMDLDSSGNVYLSGTSNPGFLNSGAMIAKLNSSNGSLAWGHLYSVSSSTDNDIWNCAVDSNGNVYAVIYYNKTSPYYICKWNSSGVLQSAKSTSSGNFHQVYIDHEDNLWTYGTGGYELWDTSLNWQLGRNIGGTPFSGLERGPASDGIYRIAAHEGTEALFPIDGSLTFPGTIYDSPSNNYSISYSVRPTHSPVNAPAFNDLGSIGSTSYSITKTTISFTDSASSSFSTRGRQYF